jgi:hypothetical protein
VLHNSGVNLGVKELHGSVIYSPVVENVCS